MEAKRFFYQSAIKISRFYSRISGGRRIAAFGETFHVTYNTTFPSYRKFRLPKGDCLSEIVRYTEFVQLHSICNTVMHLEKPTIVDIGAHHGAYAIILGKIVEKKGGKIIAVEPNPESYAVMLKNIDLNGLRNTITCEQVAIMDKPGGMSLVLNGVESRIISSHSSPVIPVEVITLDRLFKKYEISHVDLLLIDVEGAELPVLRSFPWGLVGVGKIFCELHPYAWNDFGYGGEDLGKFLKNHGYRCFDMYFQEHNVFKNRSYTGPSFFISSI